MMRLRSDMNSCMQQTAGTEAAQLHAVRGMLSSSGARSAAWYKVRV
jgi:hypothetical protein